MKILSVFGTRPEAIKMAPVSLALRRTFGEDSKICVTGQHRDMLDQVLKLFEITPAFDLNIMKVGQDLTEITADILRGLKEVFKNFKPDRVIVHGDTTTTFAASLAAFYQKIPVAHIEAGLRSGNLQSPWPEEANRRLVSVIADIHFAPTALAAENLIAEGVNNSNITITGNTVIDALLYTQKILHSNTALQKQLESDFSFLNPTKKLILITGHRRENFGPSFIQICEAIAKISGYPDVEIVYAVHLNPNVQKPVRDILSGYKNIFLIAPQDYPHFVYLMDRCYFIITDSGGIQEEAPSLGKPVLVTRNVTERQEAVESGTVRLVGTAQETIIPEAIKLLQDPKAYEIMTHAVNPYGNGSAAEKIVQKLLATQTFGG